jgi:hypothetical protein
MRVREPVLVRVRDGHDEAEQEAVRRRQGVRAVLQVFFILVLFNKYLRNKPDQNFFFQILPF